MKKWRLPTAALFLSCVSHAQSPAIVDPPVIQLLTQVPWVNLDKPVTADQLNGRVILLDFWTYCCINCMHVIPDLQRLEQEFGDKLVVLGIHSAKFENERDSDQIAQAILKYGLHHPVANDAGFTLWRALGIQAWPSFALISSAGKVTTTLSGEDIYGKLQPLIAQQIVEAEAQKTLKKNTFKVVTPKREGTLSFPGRLIIDPKGQRLFVSDSEHHKIRIFDLSGKELGTIGSGMSGLKDGSFTEAQFHSPQGLALKGDELYVADTDNHALRLVNLASKAVTTLFGTGQQSHADYLQVTLTDELNSPWDLALRGPDLLITMAGTHQIYELKADHKLERFAGTGQENLIDGPLNRAALAQTSGISVAPNGKIYFVDAETSSLRVIDGGQIHTLVGAGLFAFGLKDGKKSVARLQHPLGVWATNDTIYVADTYNHAIRAYDVKSKELRTLAGGKAGDQDGAFKTAQFREPNDVALLGDALYVTDTNNNAIRVLDLKNCTVRTLKLEALKAPVAPDSFLPNLKFQKSIAANAKIPFVLHWQLPKGMKINTKTPSRLHVIIDGNETAGLDARDITANAASFDLSGLRDHAAVEGTFYFCNADNTGSCRIESLRIKIKPHGHVSQIAWNLGL